MPKPLKKIGCRFCNWKMELDARYVHCAGSIDLLWRFLADHVLVEHYERYREIEEYSDVFIPEIKEVLDDW